MPSAPRAAMTEASRTAPRWDVPVMARERNRLLRQPGSERHVEYGGVSDATAVRAWGAETPTNRNKGRPAYCSATVEAWSAWWCVESGSGERNSGRRRSSRNMSGSTHPSGVSREKQVTPPTHAAR
ncbi:hypothetical protein GCM10027073_43290 [Streptomyces chlorus]